MPPGGRRRSRRARAGRTCRRLERSGPERAVWWCAESGHERGAGSGSRQRWAERAVASWSGEMESVGPRGRAQGARDQGTRGTASSQGEMNSASSAPKTGAQSGERKREGAGSNTFGGKGERVLLVMVLD
eukprot:360432-Chlamydomonas_euryale.AAC.1